MSATEPKKNITTIIRTNDNQQTTIEATILEYDKTRHIITIDSKYLPEDATRLSLLIFEDNSVIECQGIVRKQNTLGRKEISLFSLKSKENRSAIRYTINTDSTIQNIIISGKVIPLNTPIEVTIENISTNGVLISTSHPAFNINSSFQLKLNIGGNDVVINTSIVRIENMPNQQRKLGCRFISLGES